MVPMIFKNNIVVRLYNRWQHFRRTNISRHPSFQHQFVCWALRGNKKPDLFDSKKDKNRLSRS